MFRGYGEGVEREKSNFNKEVLRAFLGIMGRKNGVCVGRCMCSRNHGGKKVICKKLILSALSGILGHFKSEYRKKGTS